MLFMRLSSGTDEYATSLFFQSIALIKKCLPCSFIVFQIRKRGFQSFSCAIYRISFGCSAATDQRKTKANHASDAIFFKIHLKSSSIKYTLGFVGDTRSLNRLMSVRIHEPSVVFYLNPCFLYFYYILFRVECIEGVPNLLVDYGSVRYVSCIGSMVLCVQQS